jgi:AraC-like DNA-binding protein
VGRRRKAIDPERVLKLGRLGCTNEEIADILGCSHDTLERRFACELSRARATRKMRLRRAQTYRAERDRSDTMLIHLGKHELGQNDAQEQGGMTRDQLDEVLDAITQAARGNPGGSGPGAAQEP